MMRGVAFALLCAALSMLAPSIALPTYPGLLPNGVECVVLYRLALAHGSDPMTYPFTFFPLHSTCEHFRIRGSRSRASLNNPAFNNVRSVPCPTHFDATRAAGECTAGKCAALGHTNCKGAHHTVHRGKEDAYSLAFRLHC
jgi:hypothetical protein